VARAKKFREVDNLEHESIQNVPELLESISKFLQEHETASTNDCTHTVFENYSDWWVSAKPTYKLAVAEDNTVDQLHWMIAQLYDLGIPLTLTEKRTPVIRLIQEVEIWGTEDETVTAAELVNTEGAFLKLLGTVMGMVFPNLPQGQDFLDCVVFDATGLARKKGIQKTSVRFVWSSIVVDRSRAGKIYDYILHKFMDSEDPEIKAFEERVKGYNEKENQWNNIFNDGIYFGRHGIRMPLCDRVSPAPFKKPENRPFKPVGVIRFNYQEGQLQNIETMCDHTSFTGAEWVKLGHIRRDAGQELTDWVAPVLTGAAASRTRPQGDRGDRGYVPRAEPGTRQPGQARIRTSGGSGERPFRAQPRSDQQVRAENLITVSREFDGSLAEFRDQIEKVMGGQQGSNFTEDEERLVWQQTGDTGRIEMKASNKRVYISGKPHQVRSLLLNVATFCHDIKDGQSSVASAARSRQGSRPCSEHGGVSQRSGGNAPSQVYAPSAVYAPSQAFSAGGASLTSTRGGGVQADPQKREAIRVFLPEGQGELHLEVGDSLTIEHDPDRAKADANRWVHGTNQKQEKGWFPLAYTKVQVEESALTAETET